MREYGEKVRHTLLSEKPQPNSFLISVFSVLLILVFSVYCWNQSREVYTLAAAIPNRVIDDGEIWRLFSAIFLHADLRHYFSNALLFLIFSYLIYGYFGFWLYPVAMLLLGAATNYLSLWTYYPAEIRLVGASGVVYLMAGFWLAIFLLVERRLPVKKRVLHATGWALIVLVPSALYQNVSYRTHLIGFLLGIALAGAYFALRKDAIRASEKVEKEEESEPRLDQGEYIV